MKVVYFSLTGKVRKFVKSLNMNSIELNDEIKNTEINEDYVVVVPSYEDKEITEIVNEFIEYGNNQSYLKGVAGSGNIAFDDMYVITAKRLSAKYKVPLLISFEFEGTDRDIESFKKEVSNIE